MNTLEYNTTLADYLHDHDLIDQETRNLIRQQDSRSVRELLVEEKILSSRHLRKIEQLLAGAQEQYSHDRLNYEHVHHVPFSQAKEHRLLVVDRDSDGRYHLVSDSIGGFGSPVHVRPEVLSNSRLSTTDRPTMDRLLDRYQNHHKQTIASSLERTAKRVRTRRHYGSPEFKEFFPTDAHHEIAQDLAAKKLLRQLYSYAELHGSHTLQILSGRDSLGVYYLLEGTRHSLYQLPKDITSSITMAIQYACDLPLGSFLDIQRSHTSELHPDRSLLQVSMKPVSNGISIVLEAAVRESFLPDLGLSTYDQQTIAHDLCEKGIIVVTGKKTSGKSYGYYQLLDHASGFRRTLSLEETVEYSLSGVEQTMFSKRPDKDISYIASLSNTVVGYKKFRRSLTRPLVQSAYKNSVIIESEHGLVDMITTMRSHGIPQDTQVKLLKGNLLSYAVETCPGPVRHTPDSSARETLENYISVDEYNTITGQSVPRIDKGLWYMKPKKKRFFSRDLIAPAVSETIYIRSYCRGKELADILRSDTKKELQDAITSTHKHHLLRAMLPLASVGTITLDSIIGMLRS